MGLAVSRRVRVGDLFDKPCLRQRIQQSWTSKNIQNHGVSNHQEEDRSTLQTWILKLAAKDLILFLKTEHQNLALIQEWNVLEVMSGNLNASNFVYETLMQGDLKCPITWLATDVIQWKTNNPNFPFQKCHAVDAVAKYGLDSNILLLISPPPHAMSSIPKDECEIKNDVGYSDFFACYDYIEQTKIVKKPKFIVFVGELGASDGSEGMYCFLMEHANLNLRHRSMLYETIDMYLLPLEKELFIFEIKP